MSPSFPPTSCDWPNCKVIGAAQSLFGRPYCRKHWLIVQRNQASLAKSTLISKDGPVLKTLALLLLSILLPFCAHASATFVKTDLATGANYKGVYGSAGSAIALISSNPPAGISYTVINDSTWTWQSGVFGGTCYYNTGFSIAVNVASGTEQVALYVIDYDKQGRTETITAAGAAAQTVSNFTAGEYLVYDVTGSVTFNITENTGPNAVVSALFFDPTTAPPAAQSIVLNWTASTTAGVTQYLIERAASATATPTLIGAVPASITTFTDTAVAAGQSYVYTVLAVIAQSVPSSQASVSVP
jgi:hypothetical protein